MDLQAAEKGLASCMLLSNIPTAWVRAFIDQHRLESLEEFVYVVDGSRWEASLKELADEAPPLKDNRSIESRVRDRLCGYAAVQNAQTVEKTEGKDLDQPIPENYFQQLDQEWRRSYAIRIWRGLRRSTLTLAR